MAQTQYTSMEQIARRLRTASGRVNLDHDEPIPGTNDIDMSYETADSYRINVERTLERRFSRFYSVPLVLTADSTVEMLDDIACKLTAYEIWTVLNPEYTTDVIPAAVMQWKTDAEVQLEQIIPKNKNAPVIGRDIILEGEATIVAADDPSVANFSMTKGIPYGKTTT